MSTTTATTTRRVHLSFELDGRTQQAFYDMGSGNSVQDEVDAVQLLRRYLWGRLLRTRDRFEPFVESVDRIEHIATMDVKVTRVELV